MFKIEKFDVRIILPTLLSLISLIVFNIAYSNKKLPQLFLFLGGDEAIKHAHELKNDYVSGAQIIYSWKQLEPHKGKYDFSKIDKDLNFLNNIHKRLFIQIQDRSFEPKIFNVPDYIRTDSIYRGGVAMQFDFPGEGKPISCGWVARVWDPAVRKRFQSLLTKLGTHFDGKIYGVNLPETSFDFDPNNPPSDFTSDKYFQAEIENMTVLRNAFKKSIVIQYINFFPGEWENDHHYMSRFFAYAKKHQIGLGGPDVVPYKNAQMKNSYPFFHKFNNNLLVGMAIQEPDYTYKDPTTGDYYHFIDFYNFAKNYLGATLLFWNIEEPFFSSSLAPNLNNRYFKKGVKCQQPPCFTTDF